MTRNSYDEQLKGLYHETVLMAGMVENALSQACKAVERQDYSLARVIMDGDEEINDKQSKIENDCIELIATQQPIAKDLRLLISILNIITDLERMGDHAADICEVFIETQGEGCPKLKNLPQITSLTSEMVKRAVDAYAYNDAEGAAKVREMEEELDQEFAAQMTQLEDFLQQHPASIRTGIRFILILKYLERVGDHATNLCESVIYNVTGKHEKLN